MRQLEPSHHGLQLRKLVDENTEYCAPGPHEALQAQVRAWAPGRERRVNRYSWPLNFDAKWFGGNVLFKFGI